jgi:hypothetical protein
MASGPLVNDEESGSTNGIGLTACGAIRASVRRSRIDSRDRETSSVCR